MYSVTVRDHVMIAHTLKGAIFGPAQGMHGATYVIDVTFRRRRPAADGIVVDIGAAIDALKAIVGRIAYKNLDELPEFAGVNTTTEFLARWVFDQMKARIDSGGLGAGAKELDSMAVLLNETPNAAAGYEASLKA